MDRNKKILCALLILLGLSVAYRLIHPFEQREVSTLNYGAGGHGPANRPGTVKPVPPYRPPFVKLSLLDRIQDRSRDVVRNPFYEDKRSEVLEKPEPAPERIEAAPEKPMPPDPMETVNRELGQMKVFGYYEGLGNMKLFIERGREILVISEGDKIDGKYFVKQIGNTQVTLRAEHIGQDVHIDLSGM